MHRISLSCHPERTSEYLDWLWAIFLISMFEHTHHSRQFGCNPDCIEVEQAFKLTYELLVNLLLVAVVRPNDFADVAFVDCLIRGVTLSPIIDDHPMVWPLRLVTGMCRLAIGCSRHSISTLSLPWLGRMGVFYNPLQGSLSPLPSSWCSGEKILLMMLRR